MPIPILIRTPERFTPIETTPSTQFIPAGPLRFFYGNVGEIAVCVFILTAVLAFFADAWWFYHWKIKKPLAILNNAARKIGQNDLDFHVQHPSTDELGRLCRSIEIMRGLPGGEQPLSVERRGERKRLNAAFSHDLRTPLTVLQGYSDLLLDALTFRGPVPGRDGEHRLFGDLSPEETVNTVLTMKRSLTRLQRYVESMNSIQRLEDLKPQKASVPFFSLCGQLKETGEILRGQEGFQFSAQEMALSFWTGSCCFRSMKTCSPTRGATPKQRYGLRSCWKGIRFPSQCGTTGRAFLPQP